MGPIKNSGEVSGQCDVGFDGWYEEEFTRESPPEQIRPLVGNQVADADVGIPHRADAVVFGVDDKKADVGEDIPIVPEILSHRLQGG